MGKKLSALILVFALTFCFLASCKKEEESTQDGYKATIVVSFSSADEALAEAISSFGSSTYTLYSSGDNLKIESSASLEGVSVNRTYTVIDNMIYNTTDMTAGNNIVTQREKAEFSKIDRAELILSVGAGADLDLDDFDTVTKMNENNKQKTVSYVCSDISEEPKASLISIFAKKFQSFNATVELDDVQYYVEYKDEVVANYILTANFVITINGVSYSVNMGVECTYDYNAKFEIDLPDGAEDYLDVRYDDIIG